LKWWALPLFKGSRANRSGGRWWKQLLEVRIEVELVGLRGERLGSNGWSRNTEWVCRGAAVDSGFKLGSELGDVVGVAEVDLELGVVFEGCKIVVVVGILVNAITEGGGPGVAVKVR
jgi:hypothetical protein